jgi:Holliday junction resolvase-like predicted endonuclease
MSNYLTGHSAEVRAAEYLKNLGFKIKELNWKTKYCEIDIIAEKGKAIYFIEVKYRRNNKQGFGLDYITSKKLRQMRFAAEMWVGNSGWSGEYQLAAVGMDGDAVTFVDEL